MGPDRRQSPEPTADAQALRNRAMAYYYGTDGMPKDWTEAARWYREAALLGDTAAQVNLGQMYENGRGVTKSSAEAVRWYRMAADQGNSTAKDSLARLGQAD